MTAQTKQARNRYQGYLSKADQLAKYGQERAMKAILLGAAWDNRIALFAKRYDIASAAKEFGLNYSTVAHVLKGVT